MTGLEALKQVKNFLGYNYCSVDLPNELELIEKSLKALEIINKKRVNVGTFIHLTKVLKKDYEKCNGLNNTFGANICDSDCEFLTEEEFNLLKEVLGC